MQAGLSAFQMSYFPTMNRKTGVRGILLQNCASGDILDFLVDDLDQQLEPRRLECQHVHTGLMTWVVFAGP